MTGPHRRGRPARCGGGSRQLPKPAGVPKTGWSSYELSSIGLALAIHAAEPVALKLRPGAPLYKREVLSDGLAKLIRNEWTSAAAQRLAGLRSGRPAEKLQQGGRGAQRHAGRDQPPDPCAGAGSRGAAVPPAQSRGRADRLGAGAAARALRRVRRDTSLGAAAAGA